MSSSSHSQHSVSNAQEVARPHKNALILDVKSNFKKFLDYLLRTKHHVEATQKHQMYYPLLVVK